MRFLSVVNNCSEVEYQSQPEAGLKRSGDTAEQTFESIYKIYFISLCMYATKIIKDKQVAEDIVADVFAKLFHQFGRFDTGKIDAWLLMSTRNMCLGVLKQQKQIAKSIPTAEAITSTDEAEIEAEISSLIYDELSKLPPQRKQIMIQLFMKGFTSQQVAQRMKLSRQTVINQKVRALKVLRNNILRRLFS
jgi:RNA polymerase sigma-70 factor (ECF subfamily)